MRRVLIAAAVALAAALALPAAGHAATYYVSPGGSDTNAGTSPEAAWQTLGRVTAGSFAPGDTILLQGGASFAGPVYFDDDDAQDPAAPVTLGSFGEGRARIDAPLEKGVQIRNTGGVTVQDLDIAGSSPGVNDYDGIKVVNDDGPQALLGGITVRRVHVQGFGRWGVSIGGWNGARGFRDVLVDEVEAEGNGRGGIVTYGAVANVNRNVRVQRSSAHDNPGRPGLSFNTGNGIVLGAVDGGTVTQSVAYDNGGQDTAAEGPEGIWAYDSNAVTIERNEAWGNTTGGGADGGGFGLDQNTTNSTVRFNYSHGNRGPGVQVFSRSNVHSGNSVRYNVSENDGRGGPGGIAVFGPTSGLEIEHNTVFAARDAAPNSRGIFLKDLPAPAPAQGLSTITVRNNLLVATGGLEVVRLEGDPSTAGGVRFQGNGYWAGGATLPLSWAGSGYTSLTAWRGATGQERVGGADTGLAADPRLTAPGAGGTFGLPQRADQPAAYRLQAGSPMIDRGLDLRALGGDPSPADLFGVAVPTGPRPDIGASEAAFAGPTAGPGAGPGSGSATEGGAPATITARPTGVIDGDSFRARAAGSAAPALTVRLAGVTAPAPRSGRRAARCGSRQATAALLRLLYTRPRDTDRDRLADRPGGRARSVTLSPDAIRGGFAASGSVLAYGRAAGADLGLTQLRRGWARAGRAAFARRTAYRSAERRAKRERRGGWRLCGTRFGR